MKDAELREKALDRVRVINSEFEGTDYRIERDEYSDGFVVRSFYTIRFTPDELLNRTKVFHRLTVAKVAVGSEIDALCEILDPGVKI